MFGYKIIKQKDYEVLKAMEGKFKNLSEDYNYLLSKFEQEKKDNLYFREQIEKFQKEKENSFRPKNKRNSKQPKK